MNSTMFQLTFLGTSSGMPTRERNVTGLAVQSVPGAGWLLVDCGEGTQHRLLQTRLSLHDLAVVCITHVHGDHCYGLPGLLESAGMAGRKQPLTLIAPTPVWQWLQATRTLTDAPLPYEVQHVDADAWGWHSPTATLRITRHALQHRVPSHAFRITATQTQTRLRTEALRATGLLPGPAWRALHDGHDVPWQGGVLRSADFTETHTQRACIVVGGDNADPTLLRAACEDAQLLVHEATFTQTALDKVGRGPMHSAAGAVAAFAESVALPNLILTHLSARHQHADGLAQLRAEAAANYHGALWIANDLDVFALDAQGKVSLTSPSPLGERAGGGGCPSTITAIHSSPNPLPPAGEGDRKNTMTHDTTPIAFAHPIEPAVRAQILAELDAIEKRHDVQVLFACESGSRGWGFASPDSDYDVRFIYVHRLPWYLSVEPGRDVIEVPISGDLDVNGWDLRKALQLLRRSNPTLLEWLRSPIAYREDAATTAFAAAFRALAERHFSPLRGYHHYVAMAKKNFREYLQGETVRYKKYLYVLRPLLAARWIREGRGVPPMRFAELAEATLSDRALREEINRLLEVKMRAGEAATSPRWTALNTFIDAELALAEAHSFNEDPHGDVAELDAFLAQTILDNEKKHS